MMAWYLIRSTGMVALLAFTLSLTLGCLSSVGGTSDRAMDRRLVRQLVHRSAAVLGLVALTAHLVLVVEDAFLPTSVAGVLIPLRASYRPAALALGTLAMYSLVAAALSGWLRGRLAHRFGDRAWRRVHLTAYAGWALSMGHGYLAGSDSGRGWAQGTYVVAGLAVAVALLVRLAATGPRRVLDHLHRPRLVHSRSPR